MLPLYIFTNFSAVYYVKYLHKYNLVIKVASK